MVDDNFPTDTKAPRPIRGTIWAKGQLLKAKELTYSFCCRKCEANYAVPINTITCPVCDWVAKAEGPTGGQTLRGKSPGEQALEGLPTVAQLETLAEVAERLRLEARAGHRKYKGPNVFQHLLRRAPKSEAKPRVKSEAARNLAMMMTKKGKVNRAN